MTLQVHKQLSTAQMKNPLSWDEKNLLVFIFLQCEIYSLSLTEKKKIPASGIHPFEL
jgi:hypothetical protein